MRKALLLLSIFCVLCSLAGAQTLDLRLITPLPTMLEETSGIESNDGKSFWTHNDGGDGPNFYKLDTLGKVIRIIKLNSAINKDWEDVTQDSLHNFYIADFGNNDNNRQELKIYKIPNPDSISTDTVTPHTIWFTYPEQKKFPPDDTKKNYDAEAIIAFNNALYIFTKNRTVPFSGYTYLYKLPNMPGSYQAVLLDSFKTGAGLKEQWWITGADISPDNKTLVLLSYDKMFVFTDFTGDNFFKGKVKQVQLNSFTQKEAIVFISNQEFYVTDEFYSIFGGRNLYFGDLRNIKTVKISTPKKKENKLIGIQASQGENVIHLEDLEQPVAITITDLTGKTVKAFVLNKEQNKQILELRNGVYIITASDGVNVQNVYRYLGN